MLSREQCNGATLFKEKAFNNTLFPDRRLVSTKQDAADSIYVLLNVCEIARMSWATVYCVLHFTVAAEKREAGEHSARILVPKSSKI